MQTTITVHGFKFNVQGDGFVKNHAEADFEKGVKAIELALSQFDRTHVEQLHTEEANWRESECDGDRPKAFDRLESIGASTATVGWHRPEAAFIMVSGE